MPKKEERKGWGGVGLRRCLFFAITLKSAWGVRAPSYSKSSFIGRARAANGAKYIKISQEGNQLSDKENTNRVREDIMHVVLRDIVNMDPDEYKKKMRDMQVCIQLPYITLLK